MANYPYPYHGVIGSYPIYTADEVIQRGHWIRNRNPYYSQGIPPYKGIRGTYMQAESFDCSSYIGTITGYAQALGGAPATPFMQGDYQAYGYQPMTLFQAKTFGGLKKGDVLVWNWSQSATGGAGSEGHTAIYAGDGMTLEMSGGGCIYQQYRDICNSKHEPWQIVLRNPKSGFYPVKWEGN